MTTQQSTIDKLQVTVDSKDKMMDYLNDALQTLKTRVETQGNFVNIGSKGLIRLTLNVLYHTTPHHTTHTVAPNHKIHAPPIT